MRVPRIRIRILVTILSFAGMASLFGAWDTPFMYESEAEFFGAADLRGTGLKDVVVIDRDTGVFLIGEARTGGGVRWRSARPGGVEEATAAAFGRFGGGGEYGFAVGAARSNRIQVFVGDGPAEAAFPAGTGPGPFVAVPFGGTGAASDDVLASSVWNGDGVPSIRSLLENTAGGFDVVGDRNEPRAPGFARAAVLEPGGVPLAITRMDPGGASGDPVLLFERVDSSSIEGWGEVAVEPGTRAVPGDFLGDGEAELVLFRPGQDEFTVFRVVVDGASVELASVETVSTPSPLQLLQRIPGSGGARILALSENGAQARVYAGDGGEGMVEIAAFSPQPDTAVLTGGSPVGENDFLLFSGPETGGPSEQFHEFRSDGEGGYTSADSGVLPERAAGFLSANVLLYEGDPFTDLDARLRERRNADAWTIGGRLENQPLRALVHASVFGGTESGLTGLEERDLGEVPGGVSYVLANQPRPDAPFSVYPFDPVSAAPAVEAPEIQPTPGTYAASQQIELIPPAGADAVYRLGEGDEWQVAGQPLWISSDTDVQYYSRTSGGASSPIRSASYRFSIDPGEMDSSGNGVPDFVEAHLGHDPQTSETTDGVSDLERVLGLTEEGEQPDLRANFDVEASVEAFSDESGPAYAGEGTRGRAFDTGGSLLASGRSENPDTAPDFRGMRLRGLPVDAPGGLFVLATDGFFPLHDRGDEESRGREVISVRPVPRPEAPEVEYTYGQAGGDPADEADAWIEAALAAYSGAERHVVPADADPVDTLHAALVERAFANLLVESGRWPAGEAARATLFSFRPADTDRTPVTLADLRSLSDPDPGGAGSSVYIPAEVSESLRNALAGDDSDAAGLRAFARSVYRIGSQQGPGNPGRFPAPLRVFRALLDGDALPGGYADHGGWSDEELADLTAAAENLLGGIGARQTVESTFVVESDSFSGRCVTVYSTEDGSPVRLVRGNGRPYRFSGAFPPAPGSRIGILGIEDPPRSECEGPALQVVALTYLAGPEATPEDRDGNLLPDSWERLFFGDTGASPFESPDGSEYSTVQQYLEGTDPTDSDAVPPASVSAEDLSPPRVRIDADGESGVELDWNWSARYADEIRFYVEFADSPEGPYESHPVSADHTGNGRFEIELPSPAAERKFYRVFMALPSGE